MWRSSPPAIWTKTASASLLAAGARIDTFGVGTSLSTSSDAPSLNVLYKLAEVERDGVMWEAAKLSAAKVTYPGRKQVYRAADPTGRYAGDVIALEDEPALPGERLLAPVMRDGQPLAPAAPLAEAQARCREQIERLPLRAAGFGAGHAAVPGRPQRAARKTAGERPRTNRAHVPGLKEF